MRVAVIGCGRVGSALALSLARGRGGISLTGVCSRRKDRGAALVRRCRSGRSFANIEGAAAAADVVLLCVPDGAIRDLASRLARAGISRGKVFLHTSGALGLEPLASLSRRGASAGCIHPLAAFPRAESPAARELFSRPIGFAIAGDARALRACRRIVGALGGVPIRIPGRSRAAYHLAASLMANQVTVISLLALDLLRDRALRKPAIAKAFIALLRTAADRLDEDRSAGALTGPAARADLAILRLHLRLLDGERRDLQNAYRLLSTEAVRMSLDRGSITPGAARRAIRLLSSWRRRGRKSQSPAR